jgi:hypothetical protein
MIPSKPSHIRTIYVGGRKYIDAQDLSTLFSGINELIVDQQINPDSFQSKLDYIESIIKQHSSLEMYSSKNHFGVRQSKTKKSKKYTFFYILKEERSYLTLAAKKDLIMNYTFTTVNGIATLLINGVDIQPIVQKRYRDTVSLCIKTKSDFEVIINSLFKESVKFGSYLKN